MCSESEPLFIENDDDRNNDYRLLSAKELLSITEEGIEKFSQEEWLKTRWKFNDVELTKEQKKELFHLLKSSTLSL